MSSSTLSRLPPTVRRILANWSCSTPAWRSRPPFAWPRTTSLGPWRLPLAACTGLLVLAAVQFAWPAGEPPAVGTARPPLPAAEPEIPVAEWPAIVERPLFAPDRRPSRVRESGPSSLDGLTVLGIAVADRAAAAVVRDPAGKVARLVPGQRLEGWTLTRAEPLRLVFEQNGETRVFAFEAKKLRRPPNRPAGRTRP